jgi:DNA-binding transcriptional ArsR family regulator
MIRLDVDDETLRGVRIATSPLWDTISSLALLTRYRSQVPFPYTGWARHARRSMTPAVQRDLVDWIQQLHPWGLPSLLTPAPGSPRPDLVQELAALRNVPPDAVRETLVMQYGPDLPAPLARLTRPHGLELLAERVEAYWCAAIAPYWTAMRNVLEEEILFRGRKLATEGSEVMLADLDGRVRWDRPTLLVPHRLDRSGRLRNTQLLIVPVLFARGMRIFWQDRDNVVAISYQARGAAVLDERHGTGPPLRARSGGDDRLAILLGRGRAAVMRTLVVPTTTTAVADRVRLAPSTVSQHLSALAAAGVVRRRRSGCRVLYELDRGGFALLKHIDHAPHG